jgi:ATP phosphoribosyltransferase regulatory subunit
VENYLSALPKEEAATLQLSALYESFGYKKYRNTRFEEYSFYHDYQGFLAGEGVITFNSADGKLMALKPDMTLSILKNVEIHPDSLSRIYYNENVYRFQQSTREYKEIHQCGLEMIGPMDAFAVGEIVLLALQSLAAVDEDYVLTLSHADLVASVLLTLPVEPRVREQMAVCLQKKNLHDLQQLAEQAGLSGAQSRALEVLSDTADPLQEAAERLAPLKEPLFGPNTEAGARFLQALEEVRTLHEMFKDTEYRDHLVLDTSILNPVDYYSGIVMQGYVRAVPHMVLAGGRYDRLAEKLRKNVGAMGFAVYLDRLRAYYKTQKPYDVDTLLLYGTDTPVTELMEKRAALQKEGRSLRTEKHVPKGLRARRQLRYTNGQWEECHV